MDVEAPFDMARDRGRSAPSAIAEPIGTGSIASARTMGCSFALPVENDAGPPATGVRLHRHL